MEEERAEEEEEEQAWKDHCQKVNHSQLRTICREKMPWDIYFQFLSEHSDNRGMRKLVRSWEEFVGLCPLVFASAEREKQHCLTNISSGS